MSTRPPKDPAKRKAFWKHEYQKLKQRQNTDLAFRQKRQRRTQLRRFHMVPQDYENFLTIQNGVCAICERECSTGRRLAVDHNHRTDYVRGLLCYHCNVGLGYFKEDPRLLQSAIDYLRKHEN